MDCRTDRHEQELGVALIEQLRWALREPSTNRDSRVLVALVLRCNRHDLTSWVRLETLAEDTNIPISSVHKSIKSLERTGLISVSKKWKKLCFELRIQAGG